MLKFVYKKKFSLCESIVDQNLMYTRKLNLFRVSILLTRVERNTKDNKC